MCDYCEKGKRILEKEVANNGILYWGVGQFITTETLKATEYDLVLKIDRGYLRLVDPEDDSCIDHGERIEINFCPFCGRKIREVLDTIDIT